MRLELEDWAVFEQPSDDDIDQALDKSDQGGH